jgi:DNA-binding transcriptional MerR regulator
MELPSRNVFFTADIAALLRVPEWRVIKFAMGSEYQITPSHIDAAGSGTRRVYDIEDVCQIALALRLLNTGLDSKTIGKIIAALREKEHLSAKLELSDKRLRSLYLLVFLTPGQGQLVFRGRADYVLFVPDLTKAHENQAKHPGSDSLLLYIGWTFVDLKYRLKKQQEKRIP